LPAEDNPEIPVAVLDKPEVGLAGETARKSWKLSAEQAYELAGILLDRDALTDETLLAFPRHGHTHSLSPDSEGGGENGPESGLDLEMECSSTGAKTKP
jgi:hypothetical protein